MQQKVAIITGGSSGIGRACAFAFGKAGYSVLISARKAQALQETLQDLQQQGIQAHAVVADVAQKEDCKHLIEEAVRVFGGIDVLLNNAGISMRALFSRLDLQVIEQVMQINFWGTVYCTHYAMPHLLQRKGSVVGVSSIAGYIGLPARTGYSASKFAMHGFLESLRTENLKTGLHVLIACPGFTASNIRKTALAADGSQQGESPRAEEKMMQPEEVAAAILQAVQQRRHTLVLTTEGKLAVCLKKFFPAFIMRMVYNKLAKEPDSPLA